MTNTTFTAGHQSLTLRRYPAKHQHKSLQAWDSADELLVNHLVANPLSDNTPSLAVMNDEFGALACGLATSLTLPQITAYSDSWISQKGSRMNWDHNDLTGELQLHSSIDNLEPCDAVVLKVPRSLALLEWQLNQIREQLPKGCQIIAGAKVTALTPSVFKLFERYLGPVTTSLAKKKSRLLFCQNTQPGVSAAQFPSRFSTSVAETGHPFEMVNHANVFARQKLDIGARVMLHNLPDLAPESDIHMIDLGCGNGVLGLAMLARYPDIRVTFVDESHMAIASARDSVERNLPDALPRCHFLLSNCLEDYNEQDFGSPSLILCNPPFHQQNTVTEHIARQMFSDAYKILARDGELRVVANRHLPYGQTLKQHFGGFAVLASERKFVILSATRRL